MGFLVIRPALLTELNRAPPQYLVNEIVRLLGLEREITAELARYVATLPAGLVPESVRALFRSDAEEAERRVVAEKRAQHVGGTSDDMPATGSTHPSVTRSDAGGFNALDPLRQRRQADTPAEQSVGFASRLPPPKRSRIVEEALPDPRRPCEEVVYGSEGE